MLDALNKSNKPGWGFTAFLMTVLFFSSLSTILFQLALTRVFSILLWYDYAFMAISIAFFGLGIGSLYVYMRRDLGSLGGRQRSSSGRGLLRRLVQARQAAANAAQEEGVGEEATDGSGVTKKILHYSIWYAVSVPVFLLVVARLLPPDPSFIYLFYLASSVPFFFSGSIMALVFFAMPRQINKLYFADLVGAASAALLLDPLMVGLGAESVLLLTSLLVAGLAVAAALVFMGKRRGQAAEAKDAPPAGANMVVMMTGRLKAAAAAVFAAVLVMMVVTSPALAALQQLGPAGGGGAEDALKVQPGSSKGLYWQLKNQSKFEHLSTQWNSFSRVDITQQVLFDPAAALAGQQQGEGGNSSGSPIRSSRELANIIIDADAGTPVYRWGGSIDELVWMKEYMGYLPYELLPETGHALVIGSGGGQDILMALAAGADRVTAVEINPLIVGAVKRFGPEAGNVYDRQEVELHIDDGRRFISSSADKYDIVTIKLVDSWAAQLAGGYALSENYLYTVEAFQQYIRHLESGGEGGEGGGGMLAMIRWSFELPRLMPVVAEALALETGKSPAELAQHVVVVEDRPGLYFGRLDDSQQYYPVLVMVKSTPFTDAQLDMVEEKAAQNGAEVVMLGGSFAAPPYDLLFSSRQEGGGYDSYIARLSSSSATVNPKIPTDDSPFYFAREPVPRQMVLLLETVLAISAGLSALLVYHARKTRSAAFDGSRRARRAGFVMFAVFIGLGFMILEITFIQKFLLLLGTPIMALTVILFSILLSAGTGAYLSGRVFRKSPYGAVFVSVPLLAGLIIGYLFALQGIISSNITAELQYRSALTFALLFPVGLLMGFQFPSLIRMATMAAAAGRGGGKGGGHESHSTTLLWGINIIASILGTVLAATLAMVIGFNGNLLVGMAMYGGACASALMAYLGGGSRHASSDQSLPLTERR